MTQQSESIGPTRVAGPISTRESWGGMLVVTLALPQDQAVRILRAVEKSEFRRGWECLGDLTDDTGYYEIGETSVLIGWIESDHAVGWGLSVWDSKDVIEPLDYTRESDELTLDQRLRIAKAFRTLLAMDPDAAVSQTAQ